MKPNFKTLGHFIMYCFVPAATFDIPWNPR